MPRIISWNAQRKAQEKLSESYNALLAPCNENVILIQEGGSITQNCNEDFTQYFGSKSRGHKFTACYFNQFNSKTEHCTTGIYAEDGLDPVSIYELSAGFKRPVVVCECSYTDKLGNKQDIIIATVHLTANEKTAAGELEQLYQDFSYNFDSEKAWIIMGDMNCQANKFSPDLEINLSFPSHITHQGGKILDFAVYSNGMTAIADVNVKICTSSRDGVPLASDHYPIYVDF